MNLLPKLIRDLDEADLEPLSGQEVLIRVFVEHQPEGGEPYIEPYDLPYLLLLEERDDITDKLDGFLDDNANREGTVFSMEIRPMPPLSLLDELAEEERARERERGEEEDR